MFPLIIINDYLNTVSSVEVEVEVEAEVDLRGSLGRAVKSFSLSPNALALSQCLRSPPGVSPTSGAFALSRVLSATAHAPTETNHPPPTTYSFSSYPSNVSFDTTFSVPTTRLMTQEKSCPDREFHPSCRYSTTTSGNTLRSFRWPWRFLGGFAPFH